MADVNVIGADERHFLDTLKERFPYDDIIVFDVGANCGDYLHEIFLRWGDAEAWAFEPQPEALRELRQRTRGRKPKVRSYPLAISNSIGQLRIFGSDHPSCYLASAHRLHEKVLGDLEREVVADAVDLDTFCGWHKVQDINLLKIDVEGHELAVLEGATNLVTGRFVDIVQFEFNDTATAAGWTFKEVFDYFARRHYRLFRLAKDKIVSVPRYKERAENPIVLRNYIAVADTCSWWGDV